MIFTAILTAAASLSAQEGPAPILGQSVAHYALAGDNTEVRGLAFDDVSAHAPRLLVLDRARKVFVYERRAAGDELALVATHALPAELESPRGLAFAIEGDREILYLLDWNRSCGWLWRCDLERRTHDRVDLTRYPYRIGQREVLDLTLDQGRILICFDASGYRDSDLRVARGIVELRWDHAAGEAPEFVKHMPDSGEFIARGIAAMELEGARYLWVGAGSDHLYAADARTGRGLFHLDRPRSRDDAAPRDGLAFGGGWLWVPEGGEGPDRVHRVNVTQNLDAAELGPRRLRHLVMTIETPPEGKHADPGAVYHYYSRPYPHEVMPNQGTWPETETVADASGVPNASIRHFTHDPAGDENARQHMQLVEYGPAPARRYASRYEIDIWTGAYRKFVYPHRVDRDRRALEGTDYLADDKELYDLADRATYRAFHTRVRAHIEDKYGVASDRKNPYWAARDALEYIQDHYYYPCREQAVPAAVDYDHGHYDANPGDQKLDLSRRPYDRTQITACSGTSVMLAGAMRSLGFEARWLGTGNEQSPSEWDDDHDGLLDEDETCPVSNGHRYTQVWLGSRYGWICFDATPVRPEHMDFDPPPPIKSQWQYMNRAARGHMKDNRIVFNVGSELFRPLYRDFEFDAAHAVDNDCGGDQRYNLQGRFEKPELWKLARHKIAVQNSCFLDDVEVSGPRTATRVTWKPRGAWDRDPLATVSIYLSRGRKDVAVLAKSIAYDACAATVDLSRHRDRDCTITIRKDGDPMTGGSSRPLDSE